MLIRSQDKRLIVNFDNICTVSAFPEKESEDIYVEDGTGSLMVGRYSTKEKAMKVLDMIQGKYAGYQTARTVSNGLATMSLFVDCSDKVNELYIKAQNALEKAVVFQMPADSEVVA